MTLNVTLSLRIFQQKLNQFLQWHISAITCQIIRWICQFFMLTCLLFRSTCQIIMSTCQKKTIITSIAENLILYCVNDINCQLLVSLIFDKSTSLSDKSTQFSDKSTSLLKCRLLKHLCRFVICYVNLSDNDVDLSKLM